MKTMQNLAVLGFSLAISLSGICAKAQDQGLDVKIRTRVGHTLLGALPDGRVVAVVCGGLVRWSADLVFPTNQGELTLETYRSTGGRAAMTGAKSHYRELSEEDAKSVCAAGAGDYKFMINSKVAQLINSSSTGLAGAPDRTSSF